MKIDSKGLFRRDVYVDAEHMDRVEENTTYLILTRDGLIKEA